MKSLIANALVNILSALGENIESPKIDIPSDFSFGDYTTNVAMVSFKHVKGRYSSPRDFAAYIVSQLQKRDDINATFASIQVEGGGFINFHLSSSYLLSRLDVIVTKGESWGRAGIYAGKKVMVEFTDPNPFKEFHIGHLYSNTVGESIARLLEAQGAEVKRVCYQGDVGLHVAKSLWGMQKLLDNDGISLDKLSSMNLSARARFLGEAYALGATVYEESEVAREEIILLNKQVFEKHSGVQKLYETGKKWSLEYFDAIYKRLGMSFWKFYFESQTGEVGKKIVQEHMGTVFRESEGAVIFPGSEHGLHNRVFINSLGLPTYEAKELGLAPTKYEDFPYDESIIITGNEIDEYFKVLLKALSLIRPDLASRTKHISHGMVRLPDGKMSSRTGNIITGEWLLDEAKHRAEGLIEDLHHEGMDSKTVAETVGIAAVKYALLRSSIGGNIEFDFDESVNFDGNSGPYLLYTYVRARSILRKAKKEGVVRSDLELIDDEKNLLRLLVRFPDVVSHAALTYSPSTVCTYLFDLASSYNLFYQKHKVLGVEKEQIRLAMTEAVGHVLKNGLYTLGIATIEKM